MSYSEYLQNNWGFEEITIERKKQLQRISELRGGRGVLVYASDFSRSPMKSSIDYTDIMPFQDQLDYVPGKEIDIIVETPGGSIEVAENIVRIIRGKYDKVGFIIPGWAKSAGTIMAMAGDEILMGETSALGPIDAQIPTRDKMVSADAYLDGLEEIKKEVEETGNLNPAYIPILQGMTLGEIQHYKNALEVARALVTEWLAVYKFKYWETHSSTGKPVEEIEKWKRAHEIASALCDHSKWLTHGRSIRIDDLEGLRLKILDYRKEPELNDAISRYYTLLQMTFDSSNIYKIVETPTTQIYRFEVPAGLPMPRGEQTERAALAIINFKCPKCDTEQKLQANFLPGVPLQEGAVPYPVDDNMYTCNNCGVESNLSPVRQQLEAESGKSIVSLVLV